MPEDASYRTKKPANLRVDHEAKPSTRRGLAFYIQDPLRKAQAAHKIKDKLQEDAWSSVEPQPVVMPPDIEMACNTVRHRLMTSPNERLPLVYNGLILRIIEALQNNFVALAESRTHSPGTTISIAPEESAQDSKEPPPLARLESSFYEKLIAGKFGPVPDEEQLLQERMNKKGLAGALQPRISPLPTVTETDSVSREDFAYKQELPSKPGPTTYDGTGSIQTPTAAPDPPTCVPSSFSTSTQLERVKGFNDKSKLPKSKAGRIPRPRTSNAMALLASQFVFVKGRRFRSSSRNTDSISDDATSEGTETALTEEPTSYSYSRSVDTQDTNDPGQLINSKLRTPGIRSVEDLRRFSFVPGDDSGAVTLPRPSPSPSLRSHGSEPFLAMRTSRSTSPVKSGVVSSEEIREAGSEVFAAKETKKQNPVATVRLIPSD